MVAHIVAPGGMPWFASWLASLAMFGGVLAAAVWWRHRVRRRAGLGVMSAGLLATVAVLAQQPSVPIAPGYGITVVAAPAATSPMLVRVCGVGVGATPHTIPGSGRLLRVLVDGRQAAELRTDTVALVMGTGRHHISAELITADHRAFAPPVTADRMVTVSGTGPIPAAPACNHS